MGGGGFFDMGSSGFFASSIKVFEVFVKGREECFPDGQVGSGFEAHHQKEWHLVGNRVNGRVM